MAGLRPQAAADVEHGRRRSRRRPGRSDDQDPRVRRDEPRQMEGPGSHLGELRRIHRLVVAGPEEHHQDVIAPHRPGRQILEDAAAVARLAVACTTLGRHIGIDVQPPVGQQFQACSVQDRAPLPPSAEPACKSPR